jgi:hypothetical protein
MRPDSGATVLAHKTWVDHMKRILFASVAVLALASSAYAGGVATGSASSSSGVVTIGRGAASASNVSTGLGVAGSVRGVAFGTGVSSSNSAGASTGHAAGAATGTGAGAGIGFTR